MALEMKVDRSSGRKETRNVKRLSHSADVQKIASQFSIEVELNGLHLHVQVHSYGVAFAIAHIRTWLVAKGIDVSIAVIACPVIVSRVNGC